MLNPIRFLRAHTARMARPKLSGTILNMASALFILIAYNNTFWRRGYALFEGDLVTLLTFGTAVWALTLLVMTLTGFRWLQKPMLVLFLIFSAVTSYYVDTLGAVINREMVQNTVTSTFTETKHLITLNFVSHMVIFGALPVLGVLWLRVRIRPLLRDIWVSGAVAGLSAALCIGLLLSNFKTYSAVLRNHHELMGSYQPGAPLVGALKYAAMMLDTRAAAMEPLGQDARKGALLKAAGKPVLTVLVVGETARAQEFGLNGYTRQTTPELATRDVINFFDVSSCGTSTAVSLPCMFSNLRRGEYSYQKGISNQNLLDVLSHAGVVVEWWDNNTGDKQIAARVSRRQITKKNGAAFCEAGECNDGIFLALLRDFAATMTEDTVLVLHQIGSHGPAYFLRYPKEYERFTPACQTPELKDCSAEEIRNAYDNTILYTDHVLSQTIDLLAAQDRVIPALLYVSDHGESLGEDGLFLHGSPYFMAPDAQTKVPMLLWLPETFRAAFHMDTACIRAKTTAAISHDNLFHSILGLMDIQTGVRHDALDLFADCHQHAT